MQKTGSNGGTSWLPTYSETTNHYSSIPGVTGPYHDSNGNVIKDGFHSYTWDAEGLPHSVDNLGFTYDALGRAVEVNSGGTQVVYSPLGERLGFMSGQTYQTGRVPLVAGAWARYLPSGLAVYRHPDWLGSSRLSSTPSQTVYYDGAYAPYGESYAEWGTTDHQFTGLYQDTVGDLYDFPFREYHSTQGRWLSPDPAGLGAADPTNPQSLNRYAYVLNNPLSLTDPLGLQGCPPGTNEIGPGQCAGPAMNPKAIWQGLQWDPLALLTQTSCTLMDNGCGTFAWLNGMLVAMSEIRMAVFGLTPQAHIWTPPSTACTGVGRGLEGNTTLVGGPGGIPGQIAQLGTAAVIPPQFGTRDGAALAPYAPYISGTIGQASFSAVTDVIGGKSPIPGMNVRAALQQLFPGQLILEIPGASDQGVNAAVTISVPQPLGCPAGTRPAGGG